MSDEFVVVRSAEGQLLKRVVVKTTEALVYVANPDLLEAVKHGKSHAIGFPRNCVYPIDNA